MSKTPIAAIRANCLECSGSDKAVTWCACDGEHGILCWCWGYRFGIRPATFVRKWGDRLLNPEKMPGDGVEMEDLPQGKEAASLEAIDVKGYSVEAVERPARVGKVRSEAQLAATARMRARLSR